jgi:hypothetical protein
MERDGREAWAARLERCRRSGLTTKEFARREGVSARTLTWWRWKLGEKAKRGTTIRGSARKPKGPVGFVEVVRATAMVATDAFEVEVAGGYRVRVPAQFDAEALERLLGVLEGR